MSLAGAWAPQGVSNPTWGVSLHTSPHGRLCGHWFGRNAGSLVSHQLWFVLAPDNTVHFQHSNGAYAEQLGTWTVTPNDDGTLNFGFSVPRAWTHPVDFSPSPETTSMLAVLVRVV